jgi:hypothetical protein
MPIYNTSAVTIFLKISVLVIAYICCSCKTLTSPFVSENIKGCDILTVSSVRQRDSRVSVYIRGHIGRLSTSKK